MTGTAGGRGARVALVTAAEARDLDDDLPPLIAALGRLGAATDVVDWDDTTVDWSGFDLALVRSTWDYHGRLGEFLAWGERAAGRTTLANPPDVLAWNTDKRYLRELDGAGIPVVATAFLEPGAPVELPPSGEVVLKPAVSAGSRDTLRLVLDDPDHRERAIAHAARLLDAGRVVMVQPYLASVDTRGETAVVVVDGRVSHGLRKGALLRRGDGPIEGLFAPEQMAARAPTADELAVVDRAVDHLAGRFGDVPLYARVDLLEGPGGQPQVLELELTEPSMFFDHAPGSADRFARAALARLGY